MTSYPFISSLFTNILSKSKAIEGRFYVCPKMGYEINNNVLADALEQVPVYKKYPLVLMMPPRSNEEKLEWSNYYITLFFLKTSFYGSDTIQSIQQDWSDMRAAAKEFVSVLSIAQKNDLHKNFRIGKASILTNPISEIGIDRASGVRLDFQLEVYNGFCDPLEDYNESDIELIQIPAI